MTGIYLLQLRASQLSKNCSELGVELANGSGGIGEETVEDIWSGLLRGLEGEAHGVVALREGLCVVDAAGQAVEVDAGEGVDLAGVAADGEEFGVLDGGRGEVGDEVRECVLQGKRWRCVWDQGLKDNYLVTNGSSVPVVGDPLPTVLVLETARVAGDGEE